MAYEIHIDGFIGDGSYFGGDYATLNTVRAQVDAAPAGTQEIDVIINSGGGYVTEGKAIYDYLVSLSTRSGFTVNTYALGICGSIATVIAQAAKDGGGVRYGYPSCDYFIHPPAWSPQSADPLEAADIQQILDDLTANQQWLADFYSKEGNGTAEFFLAKMKEASLLNMSEAKDLGLIDEIVSTKINATKIYKIAAHISKPINITMTIENKLKEMFNAFKAEMTAIVAPAAAPETPAADVVEKTELEIANEKLAELTAKLAEYETAKAAEIATAVEAKATEVTTAVTAELTAKYDAKFTAFESKFFTGDKLNAEIVQMVKGDVEPELTAAEKLIAYRKSLSTK